MARKTIFFCFLILLIPALALSADRFISGTDTVTDTETGMMWELADSTGKMNWVEARDYCETLTTGAYSDWRLPNRKELQSIIDYGKYDSALDTDVFTTPSGAGDSYWSSTSVYPAEKDAPATDAWYVSCVDGSIASEAKTADHYVRAVRGGQNDTGNNITITVPEQSSSNWMVGRMMPIIWTVGSSKSDVKITLIGGGMEQEKVIAESTPNDGSYIWWSIDAEPASDYSLKIMPSEGKEASYQTTQGMFSIGEDSGFGSKVELEDIILGLQILVQQQGQ